MSKIRITLFAVLLLVLLTASLIAPPWNFPVERVVEVKEGSSVAEVSALLREHKLVTANWLFRLAFALWPGEAVVVAGDYFFEQPLNLFTLTGRLARGDYGIEPVRVTLPEGATIKEMSEILAVNLPEFDPERFLSLTEGLEGKLFPDTYFFRPLATEDEVVAKLRETFEEKLGPLRMAIETSGRTVGQVIIMASLVEKEAADPEVRRRVAGILWKRLDEGVPLQVDAVFPYILGKNTFEVSLEDLASTSPYNTYRYRGLPAGPIGNPGLGAIEATLNPIATPYWYYLADYSGTTHYAVDFDEHVANKAKYLY